jgi:TENA/THI-4/PQQC family
VSDIVSARVPPDEFVRELWAEVERHPAVAHPFLRRFAEGGLARWQIWGYASQHYRLVGFFTAYLEAIAGRTPDPEIRRMLRDILEDGPREVDFPSLIRRHDTLGDDPQDFTIRIGEGRRREGVLELRHRVLRCFGHRVVSHVVDGIRSWHPHQR